MSKATFGEVFGAWLSQEDKWLYDAPLSSCNVDNEKRSIKAVCEFPQRVNIDELIRISGELRLTLQLTEFVIFPKKNNGICTFAKKAVLLWRN